MSSNIWISALVTFVLTVGIGYLLLPTLRALKAGMARRDIGPTWHNNKSGTPLMGGLMFIAATVLCMVCNLFFMKDHSALYVLLVGVSFGIIGFIDDFWKVKKRRDMGLTAIQKALLQAAVAALFVYFMYKSGNMRCDIYIPFFNQSFEIHPMLYIVFAMFVMVGCVNAVNLTDGVDGLASSVTIPVMVFFTAVSLALKKPDLALLPASLVGGLLAYLIYNWHPAKVFMGDTGSLFLGGVVCAMAFALDMPIVLILCGFIYMMETISDIIQVAYFKATHGKRFFKMAPIHHHFEMCGWKEEKIVLVFTAVSALMCVLAWVSISGRIG